MKVNVIEKPNHARLACLEFKGRDGKECAWVNGQPFVVKFNTIHDLYPIILRRNYLPLYWQ